MVLALGVLLSLHSGARKLERSLNEAIDVLDAVPQEASSTEVERAIDATIMEQSRVVGPEYDAVRQRIKDFEGFRPRVYLDGKGHPTQGYGHKLSDQKYDSENSRRFHADWGNQPKMEREHADALFEIDLQREYGRLRTNYSNNKGGPIRDDLTFEQLPIEAREVLLDMAFNGGGHFGTKFPSMFSSLRNGDFHKAGLEMMYRNGNDVLYHQDEVEGRTRAFTSYFIGNNGPDRYAEGKRNIFQDPSGAEYSDRLVTVATDGKGNMVNADTFRGELHWYAIPSVDNRTGGLYGATVINDKKVDRSVGVEGSQGNLDIDRAWESSDKEGERYGPFHTEHEAEASGADRDLGPIQVMDTSRATYNVSRMMQARTAAEYDLTRREEDKLAQAKNLQKELGEN